MAGGRVGKNSPRKTDMWRGKSFEEWERRGKTEWFEKIIDELGPGREVLGLSGPTKSTRYPKWQWKEAAMRVIDAVPSISDEQLRRVWEFGELDADLLTWWGPKHQQRKPSQAQLPMIEWTSPSMRIEEQKRRGEDKAMRTESVKVKAKAKPRDKWTKSVENAKAATSKRLRIGDELNHHSSMSGNLGKYLHHGQSTTLPSTRRKRLRTQDEEVETPQRKRPKTDESTTSFATL